jgi:hypothetical protein
MCELWEARTGIRTDAVNAADDAMHRRLCAGLKDGRAIARFGNRLFFSAGSGQAGSFRDFRLLECFGGSLSKR